MISDGEALLHAICEQPWENTPRLIYADWLEENGQPERAEFIRLQIELESIPQDKRFDTPQYDRAESLRLKYTRPEIMVGRELAAQPTHPWSAGLPTRRGVAWHERYTRGFLSAVTFSSLKAIRDHGAAVMMASPVDDVTVIHIQGRGEVEELLALPWITRLTALHLSGSVGAIGAELIAQRGALKRLEYLDLANSQTADGGLRAIASSIGFPNLKRLGLRGNAPGVTVVGLHALLNSLTLDRLKAVDDVRGTLRSMTNLLYIYDQFYARFPDSR